MGKLILPQPCEPMFPVRFESGGDTTTQAFGKHIWEIQRIYSLLNALDAGKAGSNEIADAIKSITHNTLSGLQGGGGGEYYHLTAAQVSKLNSAPSGSDIIKQHNSLQGLQGGASGQYYHLTAAEKSSLASLISGSGGSGITEEKISDNGYVKFGNGLILQWGVSPMFQYDGTQFEHETRQLMFPIAFPKKGLVVFTQTRLDKYTVEDNDWAVHILRLDNPRFYYKFEAMSGHRNFTGCFYWFAIGS